MVMCYSPIGNVCSVCARFGRMTSSGASSHQLSQSDDSCVHHHQDAGTQLKLAWDALSPCDKDSGFLFSRIPQV